MGTSRGQPQRAVTLGPKKCRHEKSPCTLPPSRPYYHHPRVVSNISLPLHREFRAPVSGVLEDARQGDQQAGHGCAARSFAPSIDGFAHSRCSRFQPGATLPSSPRMSIAIGMMPRPITC